VLLLSLALLLLFALVLALPAVPSMFEVRAPKDDGRLHVTEQYVRDPRWFGTAFRNKLAAFVEQARGNGYGRAALQLRTEEDVRWAPDLMIPADERLRGIGIGDRVTVGHGAGIRDAYALEHLDVEFGVVARTLTSNRTLHVGTGVQVLRWIDADGAIDVESGAHLGLSASGGSRVTLAGEVQFERVWGAPVVARTAMHAPFELSAKNRVTIVDEEFVSDGKSVIVFGSARVRSGTTIPVHLKVHGDIEVEPGVHIAGNVIARGDVAFASGVSVGGHVFAEGDVRLGPGTRIAHAGISKTVYATGEVLLADDVEVFGWVVSEHGGRTL
jgi:carbonic anhydrase/acetyltransferase-like protein (isoleucine patch superfamily)